MESTAGKHEIQPSSTQPASVNFYTVEMDVEDIQELKKSMMRLTNTDPISLPFVEAHSSTESLLSALAEDPEPEKKMLANMEMYALINYVRDAMFEYLEKGHVDESYVKDSLGERVLLLENVQRGLYNSVAAVDAFYDDKLEKEEFAAELDAAYYREILSKKAEGFLGNLLKSPIPSIERINRTNELSIEQLKKALEYEGDAYQLLKETIEFCNESNPLLTERISKVLQGMNDFMGVRFYKKAHRVKKMHGIAYDKISESEYQKMNMEGELFIRLSQIYQLMVTIEVDGLKSTDQKRSEQYVLLHRMFAECRYYLSTHDADSWKKTAAMFSVKTK